MLKRLYADLRLAGVRRQYPNQGTGANIFPFNDKLSQIGATIRGYCISGAISGPMGKGLDETRWRRLAEKLDIAGYVDWIPWMNRTELSALYSQHNISLFPSPEPA